MRFFTNAKSNSQMLNSFEKTKTKKRNVIFYKDKDKIKKPYLTLLIM